MPKLRVAEWAGGTEAGRCSGLCLYAKRDAGLSLTACCWKQCFTRQRAFQEHSVPLRQSCHDILSAKWERLEPQELRLITAIPVTAESYIRTAGKDRKVIQTHVAQSQTTHPAPWVGTWHNLSWAVRFPNVDEELYAWLSPPYKHTHTHTACSKLSCWAQQFQARFFPDILIFRTKTNFDDGCKWTCNPPICSLKWYRPGRAVPSKNS